MMVGEALKLEYNMKKGEKLTYKATVNSEQEIKTAEQSGKSSSEVEMKMSQRCTDVSSDGIMTIDVTIDGGKVIKEGESQDLPNVGQTITIKMKKNGEIVHTSIDMPFEQPAFPVDSIKKGDSWVGKSKISIPGKMEPFTLDYNYTLLDSQTVNGYGCQQIKVVCEETHIPIEEGIDQVLVANGTTYFDNKGGRLVKSEVETNTNITAQDGSISTRIKVSVELENVGEGTGQSSVGFLIK